MEGNIAKIVADRCFDLKSCSCHSTRNKNANEARLTIFRFFMLLILLKVVIINMLFTKMSILFDASRRRKNRNPKTQTL